MQFVNFVCLDGSDEEVMHTAPVPDDDAAYLQRIVAHLHLLRMGVTLPSTEQLPAKNRGCGDDHMTAAATARICIHC